MLQLPKRVTQSWIEDVVPRLDDAAYGDLCARLRERGWTDAEIADRVAPYRVPPDAQLIGAVDPEGGARILKIWCPNKHGAQYPAASGFRTLTCPQCGKEFLALVDALCKSATKKQQSEVVRALGQRYASDRTLISISYVNPAPPPPERLLSFWIGGRIDHFSLRSGHRFSLAFKEKRRRQMPAVITFHQTETALSFRAR